MVHVGQKHLLFLCTLCSRYCRLMWEYRDHNHCGVTLFKWSDFTLRTPQSCKAGFWRNCLGGRHSHRTRHLGVIERNSTSKDQSNCSIILHYLIATKDEHRVNCFTATYRMFHFKKSLLSIELFLEWRDYRITLINDLPCNSCFGQDINWN